MAQTALMMGLTSNLCLYDVFSPEGVAEEMRQCGFDGVNITATTDVKRGFHRREVYHLFGGAPRKAGMTREDLLKKATARSQSSWVRTSRPIAPM